MIKKVKNRNSRSKGFTLIELLIAISILSLLLFTGSYSYSLMSDRWNKELGQFSKSAQVAKHLELTQRLLEGIQSYVVVDTKKTPYFFFIGHQSSLLAVSQAGLFSGDSPEVFRLSIIEKQNGLVDLVYQSISNENILLTNTEQTIEFSKSLILFSDMEKINFEYFGWRNFTEKADDENSNYKESWTDNYSGINSQYMPSKLQFTIINSGQPLTIPITLQTDVESWLSPYFNRDN